MRNENLNHGCVKNTKRNQLVELQGFWESCYLSCHVFGQTSYETMDVQKIPRDVN